MAISHPYYPLGVEVPGYAPNETPLAILLPSFALVCASVLASAWRVSQSFRPGLPRSEVLTVLWFSLCGFIHIFFESFLVRHWASIASSQSFFGQVWKEYAKSDSRYMTKDLSVLCLETMAVTLWGPLSLITVYMILTSHPMRHGFQIITSMGHLISLTIYYVTSLVEIWYLGSSHSRPEALYFWGYFIGSNSPWGFIPVVLIWQSLKEIGMLSTLGAGQVQKQTKTNKKAEVRDKLT
ncbi:uncharacterized protein PV09_04024 [Verruconis gallopava]|uniref:EXPERA domain-containing protein n=1 Tax=Verruconis gallopava TaxID=253628 RepID=A0A0D1YVW9_9PEZI|nr:uncharacterized protein PV09_04024 [Verruconis gallopava]KIW04842.1 hypothetical protein PV09_04024 [Verruconis gallopava]